MLPNKLIQAIDLAKEDHITFQRRIYDQRKKRYTNNFTEECGTIESIGAEVVNFYEGSGSMRYAHLKTIRRGNPHRMEWADEAKRKPEIVLVSKSGGKRMPKWQRESDPLCQLVDRDDN